MIQRNKEYDSVEDLGAHTCFYESKMSSSKALEVAALTVYRYMEGKRVSRSELLAERGKDRRVKARLFALVLRVDSGGVGT